MNQSEPLGTIRVTSHLTRRQQEISCLDGSIRAKYKKALLSWVFLFPKEWKPAALFNGIRCLWTSLVLRIISPILSLYLSTKMSTTVAGLLREFYPEPKFPVYLDSTITREPWTAEFPGFNYTDTSVKIHQPTVESIDRCLGSVLDQGSDPDRPYKQPSDVDYVGLQAPVYPLNVAEYQKSRPRATSNRISTNIPSLPLNLLSAPGTLCPSCGQNRNVGGQGQHQELNWLTTS